MKLNGPKTLLIADDDPDDQLLMEEIARGLAAGFQTYCVNDGRILMEYLYSNDIPDLLLLDLNMPYKSGLQCLKEIRSEKKFGSLPVVVFTTSKNQDDIRRCFEHGAFLFHSKPCETENCVALMNQLLLTDWRNFMRPDSLEEFTSIAQGKERTLF